MGIKSEPQLHNNMYCKKYKAIYHRGEIYMQQGDATWTFGIEYGSK
jgi:hypothetical protein